LTILILEKDNLFKEGMITAYYLEIAKARQRKSGVLNGKLKRIRKKK